MPQLLVEEADYLPKQGIADAPVTDGLGEEGFDARVFLWLSYTGKG
mgnify:CR=1 FL=1